MKCIICKGRGILTGVIDKPCCGPVAYKYECPNCNGTGEVEGEYDEKSGDSTNN